MGGRSGGVAELYRGDPATNDGAPRDWRNPGGDAGSEGNFDDSAAAVSDGAPTGGLEIFGTQVYEQRLATDLRE